MLPTPERAVIVGKKFHRQTAQLICDTWKPRYLEVVQQEQRPGTFFTWSAR